MKELDVPDHLYPALSHMVKVLSAKGHDYSTADNAWASNFTDTSEHFDLQPWEAADFNELQKLSRLKALRRRGTPAEYESVEDTYLDKANYAVLAYAMYLFSQQPKDYDINQPELDSARARLDHRIEGAFLIPSDPIVPFRQCCRTPEGSPHFRDCPVREDIENLRRDVRGRD